jgi:hypothetical protein
VKHFMRALHSKSVIKIVSRGRKTHLVLKAGDEDDGDDLTRRCLIPFSVDLLPFLCSLGPLILSLILFYLFFLLPSLSVLFLFFSSIFSLFLRLCISFVPCPLLSSPLVSFCFVPQCSFVPLLILSFPRSWSFTSFYKAGECHVVASRL